MNPETEHAAEQQAEIESLRKKIEALDPSDEEAFLKIIEVIKRRSVILDSTEFKRVKELIRGEGQLIPPELDLAFLDQTQFQIYLNKNVFPEESLGEILEHEATELIHVVRATKGAKPDKQNWREAHQAALIREYRLAKQNGQLEEHHAWILGYLEKMKEGVYVNPEIAVMIDRQIHERTEAVEQILKEFNKPNSPP
ncbi:TPA: hypothetical protein DCW61_04200 [Candidatus Uhrbacteria bacterium]|nr:hypothetical protein [Candidatus Uhrbacteria bacterium]